MSRKFSVSNTSTKFVEQNALKIARVALAADPLIGWVQVNEIVSRCSRDNLLVIGNDALGFPPQQTRRAENLHPHCFRQRAHAAIVRALIEFTVRVVAHRRLHATREQIKKTV